MVSLSLGDKIYSQVRDTFLALSLGTLLNWFKWWTKSPHPCMSEAVSAGQGKKEN